MKLHPIFILRMAGLLDGISLLILLCIAMPLKYVGGIDQAVSIVGSIHGGIFCLYVLAIAYAAFRVKWNAALWSAAALLVAFIPLGNFVLDLKLKKVQAHYETRTINMAWIVYSIVFFSFFDLFAQLPVMSTFATSVGASSFIAGFVIGIYSLSNTLGNITSGILTDKIGPYRMLMSGLILSSGALLLYQLVEEPVLLIVVRLLHGFVAGLIVPAAFTYSANTTAQHQQGKKVAFTGTFVGLAAIVGPAFSGITASQTSVPFVFTCVAILGILLAILSAIFLGKIKITKNKEHPASYSSQSILNTTVLKAFGGAFFLMYSQGAIAYLLPIYVQSLGYDSKLSGTLMSTFGIIAVLIFVLPTNRIFDRIAPSITTATGIGLMGISQLLISQSETILMLYIVFGLYGVGFAFLFPSVNTMLIRATPPELRGKAYGYFYAFFSLGVVAGSSVLSWLPFTIVEGFIITGIILLLFAIVVVFDRQAAVARS